jgi:hypothetical protein
MATVLGGFAFAVFLIAQITAIAAVSSANSGRRSEAFDAIQRDRGAKVLWDSAN